MKRIIFIAVLSVFVFTSCAKDQLVTEYQLDNGLKVIIVSVKKAELVSLVTLYSIGESGDPESKSGMAHLVEHLYVTSASGEYPASTADRFMSDHPKGWNAQTGMDYTVFATVFPKGQLAAELKMAAARMKSLDIQPSDLAREVPRIELELKNMYEHNPLLASQNWSSQPLLGFPEESRKAGVIEQVKTLTAEELRSRAAAYYKPANAMIVVFGPVKVMSTKKLIEERFSKIPDGQAFLSRTVSRLPRGGTTLVKEVMPLFKNTEPHVGLSYRAPAARDPKFPAFLVMVRRLQINLEKLNLAPNTFQVFYAPLDRPEIVSLVLPAGNPRTPEEVLERLKSFVAEMTVKPLDPEELKAASEYYSFAFCREDVREEALARDPYGVAFSLGRTRQMGVDGAALLKKIGETTPDELKAAGALFAPGKSGAAIIKIK